MKTRGLCIQCLLRGYLDGATPSAAFVDSVEQHIRAVHRDEEATIRERVELMDRLILEKHMSLGQFFEIVMNVAGEMAVEMALIEDGATIH